MPSTSTRRIITTTTDIRDTLTDPWTPPHGRRNPNRNRGHNEVRGPASRPPRHHTTGPLRRARTRFFSHAAALLHTPSTHRPVRRFRRGAIDGHGGAIFLRCRSNH